VMSEETDNGLVRFLIVDDDKSQLQLLECVLKDGFPKAVIDKSVDPVEALRIFKTKRFSIVLSDVNMPGMTGFELCQNAKSFRSDIRFILMSGLNYNNQNANRARELGAGFISKPYRYEEPMSAIRNYLSSPQGS
jgi:CheY-like chemotaxis protein